MKRLVAPFLCLALVSGCATSVGLQDSGLPGPSWHQRVAYQDDDAEDEEEQAEQAKKWGLLIAAVAIWAVIQFVDSEDDEEESIRFDTQKEEPRSPQSLTGWQRALEHAGESK